MGPTLYGVGSIIFLQENYPPQTPTGGMDEFEERRLKAGGGERCWKKLPGGPSNHPQNPMKNEGFKVLMPKDMGYNPQKMKVWWGSRGCKTSSDNVASLQGIVFFFILLLRVFAHLLKMSIFWVFHLVFFTGMTLEVEGFV